MSLQGQVQYSIAVTARKDPREYINILHRMLKVFLSFHHFPTGMETSTFFYLSLLLSPFQLYEEVYEEGLWADTEFQSSFILV